MSEYLAIAQQSVADGYSPIFKVQTISLLAVSVSGEGTWQLEASLDKVMWLKQLDTDNSLETFPADGSPIRFNVEKYRFARLIVAGSSGANKLNAKGLTTSTSATTVSNSSSSGVDELTFQQNKNAQSQINQSILQALDGYTTSVQSGVEEGTFQENKNAQQQINQSIRQALDGYAIATNLTGLEQTEIEHYVQHSEAFGSVIQALDGYAQNLTVTQNFNAQKQVNQTILQALDGYFAGSAITGATNLGLGEVIFAQQNGSTLEFKTLIPGTNITLTPGSDSLTIDATDTDTGVSELTFAENKNAQQQINQTILQSLDGYALVTDLTGLNTTVTENKNAQQQINQTILQSLDGYGGSSGVSELTFSQNKAYWNESIEVLKAAADGYYVNGNPITATGAATDGYGGNFTGGSSNGHGLISNAAGDGYGAIFKATTGYAALFESNIDTPDHTTLRIVPQTLEPVAPLGGDLYMHATSANSAKLVAWDGTYWNRYIPVVYRNEGTVSTTSTAYPNKIFNFTIPAGALRKGSTIGIEYWGQQTNGAPVGNVTAELYFNTALVATTTLHAALSNTRFNLRLNMVVYTDGASGTATFGGFASIGGSAADGTMANFSNSGLSIDTTVSNTISPAFYIQTTATMQMDGLIITIT